MLNAAYSLGCWMHISSSSRVHLQVTLKVAHEQAVQECQTPRGKSGCWPQLARSDIGPRRTEHCLEVVPSTKLANGN